jgi:hypothetical protein
MRATPAAKVASDLIVVFAVIFWREDYHRDGNPVTHPYRSNTFEQSPDIVAKAFGIATYAAAVDWATRRDAKKKGQQPS